MALTRILFLLSVLAGSDASPASKRQAPAGIATVSLAQRNGPATFLGSGFIYGWPDNGTSAETVIPDYLVTDIKFNANRAGGAQLPAPGWATGGYEGYIGRFNSTLSNYRTTRKYGGEFIFLPHDCWGALGGPDSPTPYPGDNGNWTEMEIFWNQVIDDIVANDMLDELIIDLWNEPDGLGFWAPPWEQYLEYWNRATQIVRARLPGTLISGPAMANAPALGNSNWITWLANIAANDTIPDHYSWHQSGVWEREPDLDVPDFNTLKAVNDLPDLPIDVNEYGWPSEQNPANAVFYLAQFERHNLRALRSNWNDGSGLHNWMAGLVWSNNGTYFPNGEWQLYKYYGGMTGTRVVTTASSDEQFDVFGTVTGNAAKIIAGTRTIQSPYEISISGLSSLGLPENGTISVHIYRFDFTGPDGEVDSPVDLGSSNYEYSSDTLVILMNPPTNTTAFAYEFSGPSTCMTRRRNA